MKQFPPLTGYTMSEIERHAILTTYEHCGRNVKRTAKMLGIGERKVYRRLTEYELEGEATPNKGEQS